EILLMHTILAHAAREASGGRGEIEPLPSRASAEPNHPDHWNRLGHAHFESGDGEKALSAYHKVLALGQERDDYETQAVATGNIGATYLALDRLSEAEEALHRAATLNHVVDDGLGL